MTRLAAGKAAPALGDHVAAVGGADGIFKAKRSPCPRPTPPCDPTAVTNTRQRHRVEYVKYRDLCRRCRPRARARALACGSQAGFCKDEPTLLAIIKDDEKEAGHFYPKGDWDKYGTGLVISTQFEREDYKEFLSGSWPDWPWGNFMELCVKVD